MGNCLKSDKTTQNPNRGPKPPLKQQREDDPADEQSLESRLVR